MPAFPPLRRLLTLERLSCLYFALLVALWGTFRFFGDVLWLPTLLLFGPRWLWGIPLAFLLPAAVFSLGREWNKAWGEAVGVGDMGSARGAIGRLWRSVLAIRRSAVRRFLPLLLSAVVLIFPVMGFRVPWRKMGISSKGAMVRVLTCNLCGSEAALLNVFEDSRCLMVDVVCLQECPAIKPSEPIEGWNVVRKGQIAIASRHPIDQVQFFRREIPPSRWPPVNAVVAVVHHPGGDLRVCAVHLTTPRRGISEALDRQTGINPSRSDKLKREIAIRRQESKALVAWLDKLPPVDVVAGDFNMPEGSAIYRRYWAKQFVNVFSHVGAGLGHTKHTPVGSLSYGIRIDHILVNGQPGGVAPLRCWVSAAVGSDHDPLVGDCKLAGDGNSY